MSHFRVDKIFTNGRSSEAQVVSEARKTSLRGVESVSVAEIAEVEAIKLCML